ncbi:MAG: glycoside hydrolase family 3 C-terminal domain-containing protein [Cyanobium sp. LacPavin_0818_WC50_MAG_67_9]|nr:glycoside hydrolase family 3 C-terminal domain-containing protein [Cyanobium sp. LacPavin_0818_WC50_MAG_67_9]
MPASPEVGPEAIERRAEELLAQLSSPEKLALLEGDTDFWPGMVDIASRDASHVHPWPAGAVPRLGLAGLHFVDGPRGVVLKGGATTFPPPIARGACWDVDLEERIGEAMAREARSFGANWLAAVCVNLLRHPGWGRAQETYGEDPVLLGALGAACTRGIKRHAVACVKHLALNSIDSSRFLVDVQVRERVLHELYLPHFRDCVEAGAGSVMSAYNQVNGEWCGQHPGLLTAILKQRWGFQGFVVTDFIFGVRDGVAAVRAGQDLEMPFRMIFAGCLEEALADGRLSLARLDDAVLRQLRMQLAVPEAAYPASLRACPEHRALAREAATKAIVLLKNEAVSPGSALLPLDPARSLAVIGPLAAVANLGDRGSSDTRPEPGVVVTPLEGLRAAAAPGAVHHASGEHLQEAIALAARCETALLVLGLDWRLEGEHIHPGDIAPILRQMPAPHPLLRRWWPPVARAIAAITSYGSARQGGDFAAGDRTQLELPAEQVALIKAVVAANPRTVVVLMGGGAILMEAWRQAVPAILLLWYPGERGGEALADVVFGAVSPSGRLPFAIPTSANHLPPFEPRARQVHYDLWHGYRRLQRDGHPAAFPFGFGLSYGALRLSAAEAELSPGPHPALRVAGTLHNDGAMASDGVVQVYVEPPGLVLERPRRTLVGFGRVSLEPGGCQRLSLAIPLRRLAYFDEASSRFWLEAGTHRLRLAQHSEDAGLLVELALAATDLGA